MSLGHSVVLQVRRVPGDVPSSITLDRVLRLTLLTAGLQNTGLVEPSSRWLGEGENKWSSSWELVLLLLILVFALLVST